MLFGSTCRTSDMMRWDRIRKRYVGQPSSLKLWDFNFKPIWSIIATSHKIAWDRMRSHEITFLEFIFRSSMLPIPCVWLENMMTTSCESEMKIIERGRWPFLVVKWQPGFPVFFFVALMSLVDCDYLPVHEEKHRVAPQQICQGARRHECSLDQKSEYQNVLEVI